MGAALAGVGAKGVSVASGAGSKRGHDDQGGVSSVGLPDVEGLLSGSGVEVSAALFSRVSELQPVC